MSFLEKALSEWREAIGEEHVVVGEEERLAAEAATFPTGHKVPAILRPGSTADVQECLRIAQRHGVPVYPVSRGRNWGYGSRVPPRDGTVLMELRRMDRILGHDERLGFITVEPGVTFAQAYEYLRAQGSGLYLTTIGSSPDASLIGNALERGDGRGLHCDVFAHVCALEVVLPDGERIETGHARFEGSRTANVHRWGVGPFLDGAFTQSNLGVVTRMTFWLAKKSGYLREFFCTIRDPEKLAPLADRFQELAMEGTLRSGIFFWNECKALSVLRQYPWEEAQGRTPLPTPLLEGWRSEFGRWAATSAIHAPDAEVGKALEARVNRALEGLADQVQWDQEPQDAQTPQRGAPSAQNLAMGYWRKRAPMPGDPDYDRDRVGFIWTSVAVPFLGQDLVQCVEISERTPRLFGFDPNLAFLAPSPRCLYLVSAVIYDRDVQGEDERAMNCSRALDRELLAAGYPPIRMGLQHQAMELPSTDDTAEALRRLKQAWDPAGVLAPGRYGM